MALSNRTIVARFKSAMEHPSEEALKTYLKEHPKADPKNHRVQPQKEEGPKKEEAPGEKEKAKPEETSGGKRNFFKGLSEKAKAFVSHSSASVQKFVADGEHRKRVLKDAGKSILASPKTYAKRLVETARHEVHEFKEAGAALKHLAKGKPLEAKQKKVLRTVAIHMGVALTAASMGSTGVLAGAVALGSGMAKKIALKAALKSLEHVHLVQEISHIGHGLHGLVDVVREMFASQQQESEDPEQDSEDGEDDKGPVDPEEAFAILVMKFVIKEMENFSDEDMSEVLEEASGEQQKQAWKVLAATEPDLVPTLQRITEDLIALSKLAERFPNLMLIAKSEVEGLPADRVRQNRFITLFNSLQSIYEDLNDADQVLDDIYLEVKPLALIANEARHLLRVPRKADTSYATSDIEFVEDARGRSEITYSVPVLQEWNRELLRWIGDTKQAMAGLERKALRVVKRR